MDNAIMTKVIEKQINHDLEIVRPGDNVIITWVIAKEKEKERLQTFQVLVISIKGQGISKNVTVRKGIKEKGVEKTFPLHSPLLKKIEIVSQGKVRRAKLFFTRNLSAKSLRTKLKPTAKTSNK